MTTLLLCGYRSSDHNEGPMGLDRDQAGSPLIDRRLETLFALGHSVICVLAGDQADEQLRQSRRVVDADLVFDTHGAEVSLTTNVKAGLAAIPGEACFVLPVEVPWPQESDLARILRSALQAPDFCESVDIVRAVKASGDPWRYGFPLLVTPQGNRRLPRLPNLTSLADIRLKYENLIYPAQAALAPAGKAA